MQCYLVMDKDRNAFSNVIINNCNNLTRNYKVSIYDMIITQATFSLRTRNCNFISFYITVYFSCKYLIL